MQLFSRKKAFFALSLGALAALGACGDDVTVTDAVVPVTVSISPPSASMNVGESLNFAVQISGPANATPTLASCTSSNSAVATASVAGSACKVTAVAAGNATVTAATSAGQSAAAAISVAAPAAAINTLTISPTSANLAVNQTVTIVPNVNKAASSVAVTNSFTSSNAAIATVNASGVVTAVAPGVATITVSVTGTGAGYSNATLTGAATVTVTALPSGITALTVQPSSLVMGLGTTAQLSAAAQQPAGAAAASITYGTSVPSVATVNSNGLVTAVAPGSAVITVTATSAANTNFAASTLTQLVSVTVSPSANVTIQTITQGPIVTSYFDSAGITGLISSANAQVNQPVDITNVRDQIQVAINLQPNSQRVDSVVVFVANADGSNRRAAARQLYSNGTANAGLVTLFVNTADFTANFSTGAADVFYPNGLKLVSASVFTTQGTTVVEQQNAENNRQSLNFNNLDGYAAKYVSPSRSAVQSGGNNLTYWGGPGAEGAGSYSIVPVFYTPNRTVTRLYVGMREGNGGVCDAVDKYEALPFSGIYGAKATYTSTAATARCAYENVTTGPANNYIGVLSGTDNYNNPAPAVTRVDGYRFSAQVPKIVANRLDYAGPATVEPDIRRTAPGSTTSNAIWNTPAVTGWVNAAFSFAGNTAASSDAGIGLPSTSSRVWNYSGCSATKVAMPTGTGADIPECSTDNQGGWDPTASASGAYNLMTRGPYTVAYTETDVLLNSSTSASSRKFGVDKTAPLIRFSSGTAADTSWGAGAFAVQAEVIDERSGFIDGNDNGSIFRNASTLNPANFGSFQHFATRGASSSNPATLNLASSNNVNCINPNSLTAQSTDTSNPFKTPYPGTANGGATPITAPSCAFINQGNNGSSVGIFGSLPDGYRQATLVSFSAPGIYSYRAKVYDRAGNVSATLARSYAVDNTSAPTFGDLNVPSSISAAAAPVFGAQISDNVEVRAYNLSVAWPTVGSRFIYPQTLLSARYNDEILTPFAGNIQLPTGAPFVTALETTTGTVPSFTTSPAALSNVTDIAGTAFDARNTASSAYSTSFGAVSLPNLSSISGVNGSTAANNYTNWTVLNTQASLAPAFLAPAGLKAQLTGNTNVPNPPFVRVEFYRYNGAAYEYLGQATSAAQSDQGTTRWWTWTLTSDAYAKTPTALETTQAQVAVNDRIIAIGVRPNGAGLATDPSGIVIGGEAITIGVTGLPAGAPASITISNGMGYSQTVTGAGNYILPGPGTYFVTGGPVNFNNQNYVATSVTPSGTVVVASNSVGTATVNYANATTSIKVAISGVVGTATPSFTISGPSGFTQTVTNQGNSTQTYVVPGPGSYTVTPANASGTVVLDGYTHNVPAAGAAQTVAVPPAAVPTFTIAYTNTTNHLVFNVSGLPTGVSLPASSACGIPAMANGTTLAKVGGNTTCALTAGTDVYFHTATNTFYTTTFAGSYAATTAATPTSHNVTYTAAAPRIRVTTSSIGGGSNNLPNGIPFTVRVTGGSYSTVPAGYTDFPAVSGTPLDIPVVPGTVYNVSTVRQLSFASQIWQIAAGSDITASGGTTGGSNNVVSVSGTAATGNGIVTNILPKSSPAVVGDIQVTINFGFTGPIP